MKAKTLFLFAALAFCSKTVFAAGIDVESKYFAPDFDSLAIAFKRVVNIVKGQPRGEVDHELLVEPTEKLLYQAYSDVKQGIEISISDRDYIKALMHMKSLKERVDKYFDDILVMAEDEKTRLNRLSTLWKIRDLFFRVADFSKIST
jgi:glycyl-tRNA synthetase beta chain